MKNYHLIIFAAFLIVLGACTSNEKYKVNNMYHGFKLKEKRFVKEVNAECYYFEHEKSGARLFKIAADDPNKLFNIAFKTTPHNDCGTPHIMEHSVLNGSKHFPVKSPFDVLMKGSLNTFLNAMTGADFTTYPVASMNDKDYFNLMHVYLDAVFYPLAMTDKRIFMQEGWHYELDNINDDITYKGVVYNEMKGAYSSPERELSYRVYKMLFPDNTYGVASGGYPTAIPKLTYKDFVKFHDTYYHPSNSYIMLYGNGDLDKELDFIDKEYLSHFNRSNEKITIKLQKPFEAMKEQECTYPVPEGSDTKGQTFLNISFVTGQSTDRALCMALDVLSDALVNHESGPVRLALQKAGIGQEVSASFNEAKQNVFEINVRNADPEDKEKFKEIVFNTLKKVSEEGIDKKILEGIINRMEFNLKEGDTPQKGLMYLFMNYQGWMFAQDPFLGLQFNKPLEEVKGSLKNSMMEDIIKKYLLSNPHTLITVLKPEQGLQAKINEKTEKELADYKASLNKKQLEELVKTTEELKEYQKEEDSPEALATIPMLKLKDISPEIEWYKVNEKSVDGVKVLHHNEFTNNIIYARLYFDMRSVPQELIPYTNLLTTLLSKMNTENYSYGELDNELNIHTGGFSAYVNTYDEYNSDDKLIPEFVISAKATSDKTGKLFEITSEILNRSKLNDPERLKSLLTRHQARMEAMVKNNGMGIAMTRLASYYTNAGMFDELTNGLSYYQFVTDITDNFDSKKDDIITNLEKAASLLFRKNNLIAGVTCSGDNFGTYSEDLKKLTSELPVKDVAATPWEFDLKVKNEGLKSTSKVQYVIQGYDFKKLGYEWNGQMKVLNQVLSTDYLQTQIRVLGGAYGGFCGFSVDGQAYFASYRDPNLKETLENYAKTPEFLHGFEADSATMTRYIIGTIARMDRPLTASQKGGVAFGRWLRKETPEQLKKERTEVLSTNDADIRGMEKMVRDILDKNVFCVYGNDQKIEENKELFKTVLNVTK